MQLELSGLLGVLVELGDLVASGLLDSPQQLKLRLSREFFRDRCGVARQLK